MRGEDLVSKAGLEFRESCLPRGTASALAPGSTFRPITVAQGILAVDVRKE